MRPRLIPHAGRVLRRAWSLRLMLLAACFSGLEVAVPLLRDFLPTGTFAALSGLSVTAAMLARFVQQSSLSGGSSS